MIDDRSGARIHDPEACKGRPCVFHNPSEHRMVTWPKVIRYDLPGCLVERTCEHGVGHPDPDSLAYLESRGASGLGVHGCDGCCAEMRGEP